MNLTPPAAACSPSTLVTPGLRRTLESEQSQSPLQRNAKADYSNLGWVKSGSDVSAAPTDHLPQAGTATPMQQPSISMNQLSSIFAVTTVDEPNLSKARSLSRRQQKQRAKKLLQKAVFTALSPEERAKKSAKRKAKNLKKKANRQKKLIKKSRQGGKAPREKWGTPPTHSRSSRLSQLIQDDQATQGPDTERQEDAEEAGLDTMSMDVQYSPDERFGRAMQALEARNAMGVHRKGRKALAREQKMPKDFYEVGGNTDTVMD